MTNFQELRSLLDRFVSIAEQALIDRNPPEINAAFHGNCNIVFSSSTQAYREVLLGCLLVQMTDPTRDIRLPYIKMGEKAFNGRTLDEKVINPFLRDRRIPCSRGPYLSVFRRQVKFDNATREGLRDQKGYDAFLRLIDAIEQQDDPQALERALIYLLYQFILLRETASIKLVRLDRVSVSQYKLLLHNLMKRSSGGVFPVILVLSMIETISARFSLDWQVEFQEINVADRASKVGGDIIVKENGKDILTIEVTERPVDVSRVIATFTEKIVPLNLPDYLFAVHLRQIDDSARLQAERYFTQGYEVNFVDIETWLVGCRIAWSAVHFSPQRREDRQENPKKLCALGDFAVQMSI